MISATAFLLVILISYSIENATDSMLAEFVNQNGNTEFGSCKCVNTTSMCECRLASLSTDKREASFNVKPSTALFVLEEMRSLENGNETMKAWPPSRVFEFEDERLGILTGKEEPLAHLKLMPYKEKDVGTQFFMFYADSPTEKSIILNVNDRSSFNRLFRSDRCHRIIFVSHGYRESSEVQEMVGLRNALLRHYANDEAHTCVVMVDWRKGASVNPFSVAAGAVYGQAAANTIVVGRQTGLLIFDLVVSGRILPSMIHLVGFSLGAQIMHFAASWFSHLCASPIMNPRDRLYRFSRVGRVTGLDPAARHFQGLQGAYLEKKDADFVDILHTSIVYHGGSYLDALKGRYGMSEATGHINFFPNGGDAPQPQCSDDDVEDTSMFSCSHTRAISFFVDSLNDTLPRDAFFSIPCDSYKNLHNCSIKLFSPEVGKDSHPITTISSMGINAVYYPGGRGKHFLTFTLK